MSSTASKFVHLMEDEIEIYKDKDSIKESEVSEEEEECTVYQCKKENDETSNGNGIVEEEMDDIEEEEESYENDEGESKSSDKNFFHDWICSSCKYRNFEYRISCKKCRHKRNFENDEVNKILFLNKKRKQSNSQNSNEENNQNQQTNPYGKLNQMVNLHNRLPNILQPSTAEEIQLFDSLIRTMKSYAIMKIPYYEQFRFFQTFLAYFYQLKK